MSELRRSIRAACRSAGVSRHVVHERMRRGMTLDEALVDRPFGRARVEWAWTPADELFVEMLGSATRPMIAEWLGVSAEAVRLVEEAALAKLRSTARGLDLGPDWLLERRYVERATDLADVETWEYRGRASTSPSPDAFAPSEQTQRVEALLADLERVADRALLASLVERRGEA